MRQIELYRHYGNHGDYSIGPEKKEETDALFGYRLIADDGCILTHTDDETEQTYCVDVDTTGLTKWTEGPDEGEDISYEEIGRILSGDGDEA